jgi:dTDP-4-dehydrorhamnose 3,5-epimerase
MKFKKTAIKNLYLINHKIFNDSRGSFFREFSRDIFSKKFLGSVNQTNISINPKKFTFRGFHYIDQKYSEYKLLTLISGEILNIVIDLKKKSKTFKKKIIFKINDKKNKSVLIPPGCANGFLTLKKNTILHYITTKKYSKHEENGLRYNDPILNLKLPSTPKFISKKDLGWKKFNIKE